MPQENTVQTVLENLSKIPNNKGKENAIESDLLLLKLLIECPAVQSLAKNDNKKKNMFPEMKNVLGFVTELINDLKDFSDVHLSELFGILNQKSVLSLIEAHDSIAEQRQNASVSEHSSSQEKLMHIKSAVRIVGLTKHQNEPLGMMVAKVNHEVVVTRIMHDGLVFRQGLLNIGDVIKEINGNPVKGDPEMLKEYLSKSNSSLVLKVIPSYIKRNPKKSMFVRCNFSYDCTRDKEIPAKDIGLSFNLRDVLEVVEYSDPRWWQAKHVDKEGKCVGKAGLVPSSQYQDSREVCKPIRTQEKKLVSEMYKFSNFSKFDDDFKSCLCYEEVTRMPALTRKVVALISDDKSIAAEIKLKLAEMFPAHYKVPTINTSNTNLKGNSLYTVVTKQKVTDGIKKNDYFEFTTSGDDIYGIKYNSIRTVIKAKKMCVINIASRNLKFVMTSEFMPFVIHIKDINVDCESPDCDIPTYMHMINLCMPYTTLNETCQAIHDKLQEANSQPQWLPCSWVY